MKIRNIIAIVAAFILAVIASFFIGGEYLHRRDFNGADTVYVEKWIRDSIPPKPDSVRVETKFVYLQKVVRDSIPYAVHDTSIVHDSVLVEVPITEKTYMGENYKATIRGFEPELVDIWIKQRETTITVPYRKRWSITVGPQVGIGITPQGWQPYAGAGATFGYSF